MGHKEPMNADDWQEAVDLAEFMLLIDSARLYGLVEVGQLGINADRCDQILKRGAKLGFRPAKAQELCKRFLVVG